MNPVEPALPVLPPEAVKIVIAENQPEYIPLPAVVTTDGVLLTRWGFSPEERAAVMAGADLYLEVLTFGRALQPVRLTVDLPEWYRATPPEVVAVRDELSKNSNCKVFEPQECEHCGRPRCDGGNQCFCGAKWAEMMNAPQNNTAVKPPQEPQEGS